MNARLLIVRAFDLPFKILIKKGLVRFQKELGSIFDQVRFRFVSSYSNPRRFENQTPTRLLPDPLDKNLILGDFAFLAEFNDRSLNHEFNLLGSGWVRVRRGLRANGVEGHSYEATTPVSTTVQNSVAASGPARELPTDYEPIDWHIDFKSGYRWNPNQWWRKIPHAHLPGVDIKVPWELARMQHLTAFALEASIAKVSDPARAARLFKETQNQILDFITQNAPGFGVNWRCAMDVGIRAANWVLAVDLFRASGFEFSPNFYETLLASLHDHGCFITRNFEKYPDFRANHYLANICGLAFIAVALPDSAPAKKAWLKIATDELIREIDYQFNDDGSNFEASTSYHRLSAEMVVYTLALLKGDAVRNRSTIEVPSRLLARVAKFGGLSIALTKPDGSVTQIGDTDSGRFFKIPARFKKGLTESDLDHQDLDPAVQALFGTGSPSLTACIVHGLVKAPFARATSDRGALEARPEEVIARSSTLDELKAEFINAKYRREYRFSFSSKSKIGLVRSDLEDFGVTVFKGQNLFLSFRCGPLGQYGRAGHDHDDQLSVELEIEGHLKIADPGTYLYTALAKRRNEYRSIRAHFAPQFADEKNEVADLEAGLFYMRRVSPGSLLYRDATHVAGKTERGAGDVYRLISFENDSVILQDWSNAAELTDLNRVRWPAYSPGYGRRI